MIVRNMKGKNRHLVERNLECTHPQILIRRRGMLPILAAQAPRSITRSKLENSTQEIPKITKPSTTVLMGAITTRNQV